VHEALRGFHGSLPVFGLVTEAEALLAHVAAEEMIDPDTAHALHDRIEELRAVIGTLRGAVQPLHGDAHLRNVLNGPDGPLWNDWEDTCIGPVHWDAACLLATHRVTGREPEAEVALSAAGLELDPAELGLWVDARVLQGAIWTIYTGNPVGSAWVDHALGRR
jgi:Ser/Thr protein kinase RdoA (MazF antagonist)